jgi:hypothetical protein
MNTTQNILQNLTSLTKFEPMSPKKIYYINRTTTYDTMKELIQLVRERRQFVIQTKYDYQYKYPDVKDLKKIILLLVDRDKENNQIN